ncbi:MAG: endolytic transglycosylase MltG [Alphaproteobacteria bacterium]|nr:endolytic transglycosylase MltG [Alphaproteobacteria bacterium]
MTRIKSIFRNKKSQNNFIVLVAVIVALCIYIMGVWSPVRQDTTFIINNGDSVSAVASRLNKEHIVYSEYLFKVAIKRMGGRVQRGDYDIPRGVSIWRIARMFANGQIATTTITIPEGLTVKQIKVLLSKSPKLVGDVECEKGNTAEVCNLHDGDIFPDTYRVAKGTTRLALLDLAHKKMVKIQEQWQRAGYITPRPLKTWNDVVTLASIVQRETPKVSEMPIVASVYINRLRKNMRLQADPTIVYALTDGYGDMRGAALLRGHLKIDSPYNTYTHNGLPPAPIANVGVAAIRAVLRPADTNYLYFVADGRGGHIFSKSYEEHQKHHADWRQIKNSRNKK